MPYAAFVLVALFSAAALVSARQLIRPLTEHQTVQHYLENGGHERVRRHLDLPDNVVYNPLLAMSVDHVQDKHANSKIATKTLSDTALLRQLGYYIPGIDDEKMLTSGGLHLRTTVHQYSPPDTVRGSQSVFEVTYKGRVPSAARKAFIYSLQKWADIFPCKTVILRILFNWVRFEGTRTLAAAVSPFSILKSDLGGQNLRMQTAYTPTMAAAVGGRDFVPTRFHIEISFNSEQPWHLDTGSRARASDYDFATVAIHEACHGLFFTGALIAHVANRAADYQSQGNFPGRFDHFIQMRNGVGIARSCNKHETYQALTRRGLMFRTTTKDSTYTLFAPSEYRPGSSTYHLDSRGLKDDCQRQGISQKGCSDLMTFELDPGYTRHDIGEPTIRIMRSVLGDSQGLVKSKCVVPKPLRLAESPSTSPGILGGTTEIGPVRIQTWIVVVCGVVAAAGAAIVVFFIVTAFSRR